MKDQAWASSQQGSYETKICVGWRSLAALTVPMKSSSLLSTLFLAVAWQTLPAAEVLEIGPGGEKDLPQGREADGIRGDFVLQGQDGTPIDPERATVALCRCGKSGRKPFCDGTHKLVGFTAPGQ